MFVFKFQLTEDESNDNRFLDDDEEEQTLSTDQFPVEEVAGNVQPSTSAQFLQPITPKPSLTILSLANKFDQIVLDRKNTLTEGCEKGTKRKSSYQSSLIQRQISLYDNYGSNEHKIQTKMSFETMKSIDFDKISSNSENNSAIIPSKTKSCVNLKQYEASHSKSPRSASAVIVVKETFIDPPKRASFHGKTDLQKQNLQNKYRFKTTVVNEKVKDKVENN